jgi:hypothetical protein
MKKITFALIGIFSLITIAHSQTYTTGLVQLSTTPGAEYAIQLDVTTAQVTLTMIGPSGRWLGLGFGSPVDNDGFVAGMVVGNDAVIYDGTNLTDRSFGLPAQTIGDNAQGIIPTIDEREDWTVTSNVINSGVRTLTATRDRDTGNDGDYVFSASASSIDLVWARARDQDGDGIDFVLGWHGVSNRGITMLSFTLSVAEVQLSEFKISPNPATERLNITLPNGFENVKLEVFDVLGKNIYNNKLNDIRRSSIDISKWSSGIYLVRLSTNSSIQTKRFIKQ